MQILINLLLKDVLQIALIFLPLVTFNIVVIKPHRRSLSPRKRTSRALNARAIHRGTPRRDPQDSGLPYQKSSPLLYFLIFLFLFFVKYGSESLIVLYILLAALRIPVLDALIYLLPYIEKDPEILLCTLNGLLDLRYQAVTEFEYFLHNPKDSIMYHEHLHFTIVPNAYWAALGFLAGSIVSCATTKWFGRLITLQRCSTPLRLLTPPAPFLAYFGPYVLAILVALQYTFAPLFTWLAYRLICFLSGAEVDPSIEAELFRRLTTRLTAFYQEPVEVLRDQVFVHPVITIAHYAILGLIASLIVSCVIMMTRLGHFKPQQYFRLLFSLILPFLFLAYFSQFVTAVLAALQYTFAPLLTLIYYLLSVLPSSPISWGRILDLSTVAELLHAQKKRLIEAYENPEKVLTEVMDVLSSIAPAYYAAINFIASLIVSYIIMMKGWGGFKSRLKDSPSPALVHLAGGGLLLCITAGIASFSTPVRGFPVFLVLMYRAILALLAMVLAIFVSMSWSPMHSLLALIGVFLLAVGVYFSSGAEFLGLAFLIVYVGAVAILFLFVIMLLNVKSLTSHAAQCVQRYQAFSLVVGVCLGLATLFLSYCSFLYHHALDLVHSLGASMVTKLVYYVNYGASDVMAFATLYSIHAALFLIKTVILLIAMLGAIVLATATLDEEEPLLPLNGPCFSVAGLCVINELITPTVGSGFASTLFGAMLLRPLAVPKYYYNPAMHITPSSLSKLLRDAALDRWAKHKDHISLFLQLGGIGTIVHLFSFLFYLATTVLHFAATSVHLFFTIQETLLLSDMPWPPRPNLPELPKIALAAVPTVEYADPQDPKASPAQGVVNARMRVLEQAAYCSSIHPAFPGSLRQLALEDLQVAKEHLELANGRYYRATGNSAAVAEAQARWDRLMLRKAGNLPMSSKGLPSLRDPEFTGKVAAFASKGLRHEGVYTLSTLDIPEYVKSRELALLLEQERERAAALAAYTSNSPAISDDIYRAAYNQTPPTTRALFTKIDIVCQRMSTIPGSPYYDTFPGRLPREARFQPLGPTTSAVVRLSELGPVGALEAELLRDFHRATAALRSPSDFRSLADASVTRDHLTAFFYSYRPDRPCFNAFCVSEWYYAVRDKPQIASAFHFATSTQYKIDLRSTLTFTETLKHLSAAPTAAEKKVILNFLQTPSPYLHYNAGEQFLQDCRLHCKTGSWSVYRKLYVEATPTLNQFFVR